MNDIHSLSHTKWNCKYYMIFTIPLYVLKLFIGFFGSCILSSPSILNFLAANLTLNLAHWVVFLPVNLL